jgi:hypothetical protein
MESQKALEIKCHYFSNGLDEQPGDQPIRVFYNYILADFLEIKESLSKMRPDLNIEKVRLEFLTENIKVMGPSTNGSKITLHDTFLSFLWGYVYGIIVTTPFGGKEVTMEENNTARELRKYAHALMNDYSSWDKEKMPNPELFGKDEKRFIGVTNAVFTLGVRFIIFHEFAHIFLRHPYVSSHLRTSENLKSMEMDADNVAIDWTIQTFTDEEGFTGKLALITALNSLSFSPNKFSDSITHPAPEDRITNCLERLKLEWLDFIWGYALWSLMEWQTNHELFHLPPYKKGESFRQHFYEMLNELKEYKKTGINKFKNKTS